MFPYLLNFLPLPPPDPARPFGPARLGQEGHREVFPNAPTPARGQPPDGAYRPRPGINPEQGRWLQKRVWRLVWRGEEVVSVLSAIIVDWFMERLVLLNFWIF